MNIFKRIGEWVLSGIKKIMGSKEIGFLEEMEKIAIPIIELVSKTDLNGDGRISAASEIIAIAKTSGLMFGKELLALGEEEAIKLLSEKYMLSDFKKWFATAKIVQAVIDKFGLNSFIQKNRIVNFIIEKILLQSLNKLELKFDGK